MTFFQKIFRVAKAVGIPMADPRIARIERYRNGGNQSDGIHMLYATYKVDDLDYELMGADNACAEIKAGGSGGTMGEWFAIDPSSKLARQSFGNCHRTKKGSEWITENAYMGVPRPEFYCSPEEVIWHRERVDSLKAAGVDQPERVRIMNEERASKPWEAQNAPTAETAKVA